jgi:hypothetical protein
VQVLAQTIWMPKSGHATLAYGGVVAKSDKHEHNCASANEQNCLIMAVLVFEII